MALTFSHKHIKKNHLHVEQFTQNIYWTLADDLKPQKRARNPSHNWVEQKAKRQKREKIGIRMGSALRELWKKKGICTLGDHPTDREMSQERENLEAWEKILATRLGTARQSESHTDHQYHHQPDTTAWDAWVGAGCWDSGSGDQFPGED